MEVRLCAGYARSLDAQSRSIPISDRFFFDNATFVSKLVRGYPKTKLGPSDADYALGGSAYVLGGVHLFSRLPLLPRNAITDRLRIHGFVNAGSLIDCPSREIYYYLHTGQLCHFRQKWTASGFVFKNRKTFTTNYCRSGRPVTAWASL